MYTIKLSIELLVTKDVMNVYIALEQRPVGFVNIN